MRKRHYLMTVLLALLPLLLLGAPQRAAAQSQLTLTIAPRKTLANYPGGGTGTVAVPVAAPAGGIVVTLVSGYPPALHVPKSVTIPEGATSVRFTFSHGLLGKGRYTITASASGATAISSFFAVYIW